MVVSILKVSNWYLCKRNLDEKNRFLVLSVLVSFLLKFMSLRRSRNTEIQFFAISNFSTTNGHLKSKSLLEWDWLTIRMYRLRYTQEFQCLFSDELTVFLKESSIVLNTEERHLAYSYSHMLSNVCNVISLIDILELCNQLSNLGSNGVFVIVLVIVSQYHRNRAEKCRYQEWMIISFRFYSLDWSIRTTEGEIDFLHFLIHWRQ